MKKGETLKHIIKIAKPAFGDEEIKAVSEVLRSGNLVQGEKVKLFEEKFAKYIGVKHAVAVTNGTVALDLALKALKIHEGDEVVIRPDGKKRFSVFWPDASPWPQSTFSRRRSSSNSYGRIPSRRRVSSSRTRCRSSIGMKCSSSSQAYSEQ